MIKKIYSELLEEAIKANCPSSITSTKKTPHLHLAWNVRQYSSAFIKRAVLFHQGGLQTRVQH